MDMVKELFENLESNHPPTVEEAKKQFHEYFNATKESWLLKGLFEYYINTGSIRIVEILVGVREPHENHLFDKISESLKGPQKQQALTLLGHVVCRYPTWLYKIAHHTLLKDLLRLLKAETEIISLMSALLTIIVLLPIIAGLFGPYLEELFEIFSRLASWNTINPNRVPEHQLLHLQVGLYSLFNRLYGMYPCNFLSFLRRQYKENSPVFTHTIKPMLETVKMHPLLVTASKDSEVSSTRWKKMQANDVIMECAKFSVDASERVKDDCTTFRGRTQSVRSRSSLEYSGSIMDAGRGGRASGSGVASYSSGLLDGEDVWSPSVFCGAPTPPESAPTSIPHTPIAQTYVMGSTFPAQEGTSPPEAAVEATPESTPVKDLKTSMRGPPQGSTVIRALNSLGGVQSQPSSPMKKDPSPFRFPPATTPTPEPAPLKTTSALLSQKVQKVVLERIQAEGGKGLTYQAHQPYQPSSPLRVIPAGPTPADGPLPHPPLSPLPPTASTASEAHTDEDKEVETTMRAGTAGPVRRADSVLQDEADPEEGPGLADLGPKGGCGEGGLHMPDSRSMLQFTKQVNRLRFYSQCPPDQPHFQLADLGPSSGSSPGEGCHMFPADLKVRRAVSCPEMKKPSLPSGPGPLEAPTQLDATLEEESEDSTPNGYPSEKSQEKKQMISSSVQTDEPQPLTYEHMFLAVFPPIEQLQTHSAPPDVPMPPLFSNDYIKYSPYSVLENYIEACASTHPEKGLRAECESKTCRENLHLLLFQLQFERHRREVHAERNRRLLGKSRSNRSLEEHNSALRDQVSLLQKEIEDLRIELDRHKRDSKAHSDELQQRIHYWQDQCGRMQRESKDTLSKISLLEQEVKDEQAKRAAAAKELALSQAKVFELESMVESISVAATTGRNIREDLSLLQHQLTWAGEQELRLRARVEALRLRATQGGAAAIATSTYGRQLTALQAGLDARQTALDSSRTRLAERDAELFNKDCIIAEHKTLIHTANQHHTAKLKALEKQCGALRDLNIKQEEYVLELLHKIECLERKPATASSPGTGPQASPPLSASLSSGTLSLSGAEPAPIKNLELLVELEPAPPPAPAPPSPL